MIRGRVMPRTGRLIQEMAAYYEGDVRRINHFMKVYGFAKAIGELEELDEDEQAILETAAVVHDIGIKKSEEKYNSSAGGFQEKEGPPEAEKMLTALGYDKAFTARVCYLVGHHHTYSDVDGMDYQILLEADYLVNIFEEDMDVSQISVIKERIFRTGAGLFLLKQLYPDCGQVESE